MALLKEREESLVRTLASTDISFDTDVLTYTRGALASTRDLLNIDFEDMPNG